MHSSANVSDRTAARHVSHPHHHHSNCCPSLLSEFKVGTRGPQSPAYRRDGEGAPHGSLTATAPLRPDVLLETFTFPRATCLHRFGVAHFLLSKQLRIWVLVQSCEIFRVISRRGPKLPR